MIVRTFQTVGFRVFGTDDEEIRMGEGNVLLARVGARVPHGRYEEFHRRLYKRRNWWGF